MTLFERIAVGLIVIAIGLLILLVSHARVVSPDTRDLQVLVHDRAVLAAHALGEGHNLTEAEIADARKRCARRPEYAAVCAEIGERLNAR